MDLSSTGVARASQLLHLKTRILIYNTNRTLLYCRQLTDVDESILRDDRVGDMMPHDPLIPLSLATTEPGKIMLPLSL
jgi:hypothetical protein